jgi:hypothetical protein
MCVRVRVRVCVLWHHRAVTPSNEWWELFDANRGRPYFYNPTTQQTVWEAPPGSTLALSSSSSAALWLDLIFCFLCAQASRLW